jgi:hypothetical protein
MLAVDDDSDDNVEVHVDFGSKGLWRYDYVTGWKKLTGDDPGRGIQAEYWDLGIQEGVWQFPSGTWAVSQTITGTRWDQLTDSIMSDDNVSAELGIGDNSLELVCDFYPMGLWGVNKESTSETWYRLTDDDPYDIRAVRFVGNVDYELLVTFGSPGGLWMWNTSDGTFPGTTWTRLTTDTPMTDEAFCEPFDPNGLVETNGDEEVAIDFGAKGLWLYNYTTTLHWTKLTNDSPTYMVRSDLNGDGVNNYLICDFGIKGLWYFKGATMTWHRLTGDSPD